MVGFDQNQVELSSLEYGTAGVISGFVTRFICQPLDVVKIRFQLQVDPIKRNGGKYKNILQATKVIIEEESVRALWKGHIPAQALSITFGLVQFVSFEFVTKKVWMYFPAKLTTDCKPFTHFCCGSFAGVVATTFSYPMDVVRTRLIAQGEPKIYNGVYNAMKMMLRKEGVYSFYRGFIPTVMAIAPYTGLIFGFYSASTIFYDTLLYQINEKQAVDSVGYGSLVFMASTLRPHTIKFNMYNSFNETKYCTKSLICGGIAGPAAKITVYPFDFLKKRLQVIGFEEARYKFGTVYSYKGLTDCIQTIIKKEGFVGMYKGLIPSLMKASAVSGLTLFSYEQTCKFMRFCHNSS